MKTKAITTAVIAAALLAGTGAAFADTSTQTALNLSLLNPDNAASVAAAAKAPLGRPVEVMHDQAAIDDCFDYATRSSRELAGGPISRFDRRTGLGAEEHAFQRSLTGPAPEAMHAKLFARCLASK